LVVIASNPPLPQEPGLDGTRIGAQLRAARLAARKSVAEVAAQSGLTKGFVSKLERDLANPLWLFSPGLPDTELDITGGIRGREHHDDPAESGDINE
jgi:Helix-turn-helix domain